MKNFFNRTVFLFLGFFYLFYTNITFGGVVVDTFLENDLPTVSRSEGDPTTIVSNIVVYLISIVAILAIIAVTWSAIMMFLSAWDEQKFNKAKNILIMSLVWVAVAGGGYAVVTIISNLTIK